MKILRLFTRPALDPLPPGWVVEELGRSKEQQKGGAIGLNGKANEYPQQYLQQVR